MSQTIETVIETEPVYQKLKLVTAHGPVYRSVSSKTPRDALPEEIPVIDISGIYGNLESRKKLAIEVRAACENYGFFYIKNHGIPDEKTNAARQEALRFFQQPQEFKEKASQRHSRFSNGWSGLKTRQVSPTETPDRKEGFIWSYDPHDDPDIKNIANIPAEVSDSLHTEDFLWAATKNLPDFRKALIAYWQECVILSRRLVRIFALSLALPESYFDGMITYPGSDGAINYYPGTTPNDPSDILDVGIGSHTDLQCFTLLWQDNVGGLQVLSKAGHWFRVPPIAGTLVVNIGDFLMRLTNDRFVSTVHRVYSRSSSDRLSMPFFFGFNFNEVIGVLPSCTDEENPAKYEPISCGEEETGDVDIKLIYFGWVCMTWSTKTFKQLQKDRNVIKTLEG